MFQPYDYKIETPVTAGEITKGEGMESPKEEPMEE